MRVASIEVKLKFMAYFVQVKPNVHNKNTIYLPFLGSDVRGFLHACRRHFKSTRGTMKYFVIK